MSSSDVNTVAKARFLINKKCLERCLVIKDRRCVCPSSADHIYMHYKLSMAILSEKGHYYYDSLQNHHNIR